MLSLFQIGSSKSHCSQPLCFLILLCFTLVHGVLKNEKDSNNWQAITKERAFEKRSKELIKKANKDKSDNFTRSNRDKFDITIVILE